MFERIYELLHLLTIYSAPPVVGTGTLGGGVGTLGGVGVGVLCGVGVGVGCGVGVGVGLGVGVGCVQFTVNATGTGSVVVPTLPTV